MIGEHGNGLPLGPGEGFEVIVVQSPTISLADDLALKKRVIATAKGDIILVGRSYGGVVIPEAGNDPKVKSPAPGAPAPPILSPADSFLCLDREKFAASFAADVRPPLAAFLGDSQVPADLEAFQGAVNKQAWRSKPSWYLVAKDDKMIPPDEQRAMARRAGAKMTEARGSHAIYVSRYISRLS